MPDARGDMAKMLKKTLWLIPQEGGKQIDEQLVDKYSVVVHLGSSERNVSQGWGNQKWEKQCL